MSKIIIKRYLVLTLFITGAAVMILELIGTRVIAPIYGGGLFVWASLITVALTCLAIGYWIGGKIADKKPDFNIFYLIILIAGILIAPISQISHPILKWSVKFGFSNGPLFSAYLLFTLPMVLLGMTSPYAIKLATTELNVLGATAGRLYAISTFGSFIGTLLTGFILIPVLGTSKILFFQSSVLILVWTGYHFINKKHALALLSLAFLGIPILFIYTPFIAHEGGKDLKLIYKTESFYGQIKIFEEAGERKLYVDNIKQSSINKSTYLPTAEVYYCFEMLPLFNPKGKDTLLVGLAGANIPRRLWEYEIETDCVDIESKIEYIARKYFGFLDYFGRIYIDDGRAFINKNNKLYDFVIVDVFTGDDIPFHLITRESFEEIKSLLKERGVLGINFIGELYGEDSSAWKSVYKTLSRVFPYVKAYSFLKGSELVNYPTNIIFFASGSELTVPHDFKSYCKGPVSQSIIESLVKCELNADFKEGMVLTDDYSPIEFLRKSVAQKVREKQIFRSPQRYFF